MMQFVQWLSKKLQVTPSEVVQMLNEAPEEEVKKYTDLFLAETTQETGKFKSGGKINAAVAKFQNGGNLTRRQALDAFMANREGATRADARRALRSAKMSFDNNNMTGDRNQWARSLIARRPNDPQLAEMPVKIPVEPVEDFKPINAVFNRPTPKMEIQPLTPVKPLKSLPGMDTRRGDTFDQAFAAARKAGVSEFSWNGNRYNTNLAGEERVDVAQKPVTTVITESITTPSSEKSKIYPILSGSPYNLTNVNKNFARRWIETGEGWPDNYPTSFNLDLGDVDPEIALRIMNGVYGVKHHGDIIKRHMAKEQMKKFNTPRPTTPAPYRRLQH